MKGLITKLAVLTGLGTAGVFGIVLLMMLVGSLFFAVYALSGLIIWAAWNLVVPAFGGPHITFWMGFGISVLISIIKGILK